MKIKLGTLQIRPRKAFKMDQKSQIFQFLFSKNILKKDIVNPFLQSFKKYIAVIQKRFQANRTNSGRDRPVPIYKSGQKLIVMPSHIGIAFESIPYSHDDYFQLRAAIGVLSDGMSSRLFTEVRENRGLCYAIFASCQSLRDRGSVFTYAGTTQQRAQETLDVTIEQLQQLANGIQPEELDRLRARLKSGLIMQQESSSSRSASIASDWYYLQRVRSLDELNSILDELSSDSINAYLSDHSPDNFDVVTLGRHPLEITSAVS